MVLSISSLSYAGSACIIAGMKERSILQPDYEKQPYPAHVIKARPPEGTVNREHIRIIKDIENMADYLTDSANFPGGRTDKIFRFSADANEADVAYNLKNCKSEGKTVIVRAGGTSLTGAVVPMGDAIFDMSQWSNIHEPEIITKKDKEMEIITVSPGVTFHDLRKKLSENGLYFPPAPTYDLACIGGGFNTNAGGAGGYKYGQMRKWVEGAKIMLSSGEVLDIKRGQYMAHEGDKKSPSGYFELERTDGSKNRIPVPSYNTPEDIPKVSAGIYSEPSEKGRPGMDLLDLFIGSEGTLGIITEVTLRVIKEPPTALALVPCDDDVLAFTLAGCLRDQERDKRETLEPGGISAVEIMGQNAVGLLRRRKKIDLPADQSLLLVQVEMPGGDDSSLVKFYETCESAGIDTEQVRIALPDDSISKKEELIAIREAVPNAVNELISERKRSDPVITKVGSDGCVRPELIRKALALYEKELTAAGIEWYFWGHGEGNLHINAVPQSNEQLIAAKKIIEKCGETLITTLGGVGTSEHGIGKNVSKQKLTEVLLGSDAFGEMQAVMDALDPERMLAVGNLRKKRAESNELSKAGDIIPAS